ncbi:expansin-B15-like [Malania oleifera]|uniref:expansin-B15-like n=1 Tax=Malania oleifera TaxID=397392 RepID=UPI0025ADAA34|nr:expansin-B15-like [Malania oleifera]
MAPLQVFPHFILVTLLSLLFNPCFSFDPSLFDLPKALQLSADPSGGWSPAQATWYGPPSGDGSEGGACGYGNAVGQAPFYSIVSAGGPSLFHSGTGCGACYQVKCTSHAACSGNPVTVVITDECPGCGSASGQPHFDLSGAAFGAMANSFNGRYALRNAGLLQIQYKRVACNYRGMPVAFRVDAGSSPYYFAVLVEYENSDGDVSAVYLQEADGPWYPMQESWGAVWKLNSGSPLRPPFSIWLTTSASHRTLVASNVIPAGWQPGQTYRSHVNFR